MADTAKDAGGHVLETAKQEAGQVLDEAKLQGRRLLDQSMNEFRSQAGTGQHLVAELARSLSGELQSMSSAGNDGMLNEYVTKAQRFTDEAATWLDSRQPEGVLDSVRRYAARNPWQFLAISAGVGLIGLTLALWWGLAVLIGTADAPALGWSGLIVGVLWLVVAAILAGMGKSEIAKMRGLQKTAETVKKIPNAAAGHEEKNR